MPGFSLLLLFGSSLLLSGTTEVFASQETGLLRKNKNNLLFPLTHRKSTVSSILGSSQDNNLVVDDGTADPAYRVPWMDKGPRPPAQDSKSKRNKKGGSGGGGSQKSKSKNTVPPPPPSSAIAGARDTRIYPRYDVPLIECPPGDEGLERFACPTTDTLGRYRCIDDHQLCDGFIDCPTAEDEDRMSCMFYKTTKAHLDVLADALLRWARGRY